MHGRRHFLQRAALGLGLAAVPGCASTVPSSRPLPAPTDPDFWDRVRDLYPMQRERAYLNTGGLGPASSRVLEAMHRSVMEQQTIVEHGHRDLEGVREKTAAFFGASPAEIAFMRNATEANSTISSGLELSAGDEVIFESHAHPGGAFAWLSRQKRDGIRVKVFEPDPTSAAGNLERIEALITPRTRVIQVSHITAPTGIWMPVLEVAALAADRGIWFHIDGAQSSGLIPIDLEAIGCDSYGTSGHKWMGAPHGTGFLYVRRDRQDEVWPTEVGAYSSGEADLYRPESFEYTDDATRYEPGTRDTASIVGLGEAVDLMTDIGMARITERASFLTQYLQRGLRQIPGVEILSPSDPALGIGMTTLKSSRVPFRDLYAAYSQAQMRCRIVTEQGLDAVRVSTHLFNNEEECDRVVSVTRETLARA